VDNPSTWSSFETALAATRNGFGFVGVGYISSGDDGLCGIDFDDCFDLGGALKPGIAAIVKRLNSYTENSPSGRGLHVIVKGTLPRGIATKGVEIYPDGVSARLAALRFCGGCASLAEPPPASTRSMQPLLTMLVNIQEHPVESATGRQEV